MAWEQAKVTGVKAFKGDMDDGKSIDSGTVFVLEGLDTGRNNDREFKEGFMTTAYRLGSLEVASQLRGARFPVDVMLEFERVSDGKGGSRTVVRGIKSTPAKAA